jgi:hypothetical protein
VIEPLVATDRRRQLDAGSPDKKTRAALEAITLEAAFAHARIVDRDMAACCVSGIWLLHDYLDQSHKLSQDIDTAEGSFWHAIMHRREGDFWNSKYWFRRVGRHAIYEALGRRAAELAASHGNVEGDLRKTGLLSGTWDPLAFVDLCETVAREKSATHELCRDVQRAEWELLFGHCYERAVSRK